MQNNAELPGRFNAFRIPEIRACTRPNGQNRVSGPGPGPGWNFTKPQFGQFRVFSAQGRPQGGLFRTFKHVSDIFACAAEHICAKKSPIGCER